MMKTDDIKKQHWDNWQQQLDRALKHLPEKPAPANLLPNVIAEIQTRETRRGVGQPFYFRHPWLRVSAALLALSLMTALFFAAGRVYENDIIPAFRLVDSACRTVLGSLTDVLAAFSFGIGEETLRFLFPVLICVMLAMYLTCIGVGTFLYRTVRR